MLLARVLDGGEHVAFRERDERVGLVVLEVGVEERCVLVDQVLLKDERLVLVADDDVLERVNLVDEQRNRGRPGSSRTDACGRAAASPCPRR